MLSAKEKKIISSQDPQFVEEKGEGHNFQPCSHAQPTWCDLCGDFIWGLYKQSLRCVTGSEALRRTSPLSWSTQSRPTRMW
uniref:Phorbol-ester/DAG-type domain-containing protein n=1 Tax=Poecilia latipinna TaxID=48699 RepID=A0A3B3UXH3_9TELE